MQTKNLIQTSANVIRITNLKVGDIYKRYNDSSYSNDVYYGIIKCINNNGEETFIEAIEYEKSYCSISASMKVFKGDKDLSIFPTTIDEIKGEFNSVVSKLHKEIEEKKGEIENKAKCISETELLLSGELKDKLQEVEFKTMTQEQYNSLKNEKAKMLLD